MSKAYEKSMKWFKESIQFINNINNNALVTNTIANFSVNSSDSASTTTNTISSQFKVYGVAFPLRFPMQRAINNNNTNNTSITNNTNTNTTAATATGEISNNNNNNNNNILCLEELQGRFYDSSQLLIQLGAQGKLCYFKDIFFCELCNYVYVHAICYTHTMYSIYAFLIYI